MTVMRKHIEDNEEFFKIGREMAYFSEIHFEITHDLMELLSISVQHRTNISEYNSMYRACVKGFFSLIEADIYYLNIIDNYKDYSDSDDFFKKFKNTFKQICTTFGKVEIQENYFSTKIENLRKLRTIRDDLVHPKKLEHIHPATIENFDLLNACVENYKTFISEIMTDFFIKTTIKF